MSGSLGRRLPLRAQFVHVSQLAALTVEERARWEVWLGSDLPLGASQWMSCARLLDRRHAHGSETSLCSAPSSLVVVARRVP